MTTAAAERPRLSWRLEVLVIVALYVVYSLLRNATDATVAAAKANADDIVRWQEALGILHEKAVQDAFIDTRWFIVAWNVFYGSFHFVVTPVVLIWVFRKHPGSYPFWRTTIVVGTVLALVGYATYPLMPPRLYPDITFVDTLREYGGIWSFESGPVEKLSNQYAAMPSLHFGWSFWVGAAGVSLARNWWSRLLFGIYPVATLFAITVTGNHWFLDALGGLVVIAAGMAVAWAVRRLRGRPKVGGRGATPPSDEATLADPPPSSRAPAEPSTSR